MLNQVRKLWVLVICATLGSALSARAANYAEAQLHAFSGGSDGSSPYTGQLLRGSDGMLYGVTLFGGTSNAGIIFKIAPDGSGYTILRSFTGTGGDGQYPKGNLVQGGDGTIYGTNGCYNGFPQGPSTVFKINPDGSGYAVLHSFDGPTEGAFMFDGAQLASDGNLYGLTKIGGVNGDVANELGGTIYTLHTDGSNFNLLHSFPDPSLTNDGSNPQKMVQASDGWLYGTTYWGGNASSVNGSGTLFKIKTDGTGYTILYRFQGGTTDGSNPDCGVFEANDGMLYGTCVGGGANGVGTVYRINKDGTQYQVLYSFQGNGDGAYAISGVVQGKDGSLYGTTANGGTDGTGTVFKINADGSGYTVLYSFLNNGADGQQPLAELLQLSDGSLYGTTHGGAGGGSIFALKEVASITATAGTPQATATGLLFDVPLTAVVLNKCGAPVSGIPVTFTAPGTGASATFAAGALSATAITDANGVATAPALTANAIEGSYIVSAAVSGISTPASFSLSNAGFVWLGDGGTDLWNTPANWVGSTVPGPNDVAYFDGRISNNNCIINVPLTGNSAVGGVKLQNGYIGRIAQSANAIQIGSSGWTQNCGTFAGGSADIAVAGSVAISGGVFTSTSGTLSISGNWIQAGGTFTANSGVVDFNAVAGAQTLAPGTGAFFNLNHSGSGTLYSGGVPGWPGFAYQKSVTIDHTKVSGTQANFPVLIYIADDHDLANHARSDGADVVFADQAGNLLNYEVESYASTGGATGGATAYVWVDIPLLSSTADTVVNLVYGNPACAASHQQPASVWDSNFKGVWHLKEQGQNPQVLDSTANATNSTSNSSNPTTGEIGGAMQFDGNSSDITFNSGTVLWDYTIPHTYECWLYLNSYNNDTWPTLANVITNVGSQPFAIFASNSGVDRGINLSYNNSNNSTIQTVNDVSSQLVGGWNHIVVTFDGVDYTNTSSYKIYLNGASQALQVSGWWYTTQGINVFGTDTSGGDFIDGKLDEVRISNSARSTGWIVTEYNNQANPSAFESVSAEQSYTSSNLIVQGNLTLPGGAFNLLGNLSLSGNLANSASFVATSGTVNLVGQNQTLSGSATFFNLTKTTTYGPATLTFQQGQTQTVTGALTLTGQPGQLLTLVSDTDGSQWNICPTGSRNVSYVAVKNSTNTAPVAISAEHSVDLAPTGTNINWMFSDAAYVWKGDGGANDWSVGTNWSGGAVPGHNNVAIFDGGVSNNPCVIDAPVDVAGVTFQNSYFNSVSQQAGSTLQIGSEGWTQSSGAFVGDNSGAGVNILGNLTLSGGAYTATRGTTSIAGNVSFVAGAFNHNSGTMDFNSAAPLQTLLSGSNAFNNLSHSGTGTLSVGGVPNWAGWSYQKPINVDHTKVSGTQTNFPVLVNITDDHDLSNHARADGADLVFTDASGNLLSYEIESYSPTGGATGGASGYVWIKLPYLSATGDTVINMIYGNPSCTGSLQQPTAVWDSGFKGVWHLKETGQDPQISDSTTNANNSTSNSSSPTNAGKIAGAMSFDGTASDIAFNSNTVFWDYTVPHTYEVWLYLNSFNNDPYPTMANVLTNIGGQPLAIAASNAGVNRGIYVSNNNANNTTFQTVNDVSAQLVGGWNHIVVVYDGVDFTNVSSYKIYLNGSSQALQVGGWWAGVQGVNAFGTDTFSGDYIDGSLDEVRISNAARSDGWIATEYNNQSNPGAFVRFGSEQGDLTVQGNLTLTGGNFNLIHNVSLGGNFSNAAAFTSTNGTVFLSGGNQSLSGSTTFNNLTKIAVLTPATLTFQHGQTQTITGTLNLQGVNGVQLTLQSDVAGQQWLVNPVGARTIAYLNVSDSDNINASPINAIGSNSTDGGNNTNWTFGGGAPQFTNLTPANGTWINNSRPTISADILGNNLDMTSLSVSVTESVGNQQIAMAGMQFTTTGNHFDLPLQYDLSEGTYQVAAQISTTDGQTASATWGFQVDLTPPVISGLADATTNSVRPPANVTVSDALSGIDYAHCTLTLDTVLVVPQTAGNGAITFTPTTDLSFGAHQYVLTVKDIAGNSTVVTANIQIIDPTVDTTPPVLGTSSPAIGIQRQRRRNHNSMDAGEAEVRVLIDKACFRNDLWLQA